jgi:hypothetical protein
MTEYLYVYLSMAKLNKNTFSTYSVVSDLKKKYIFSEPSRIPVGVKPQPAEVMLLCWLERPVAH